MNYLIDSFKNLKSKFPIIKNRLKEMIIGSYFYLLVKNVVRKLRQKKIEE